MFLLCRKALRNVELLKDLDWPLFQIIYFAKNCWICFGMKIVGWC